MENEKKEKVKKIFRGIWLGVTTFVTFIFTICVVIGCSQQNKQSNAYSEYDVVETYDNEYQLKYDNHKNVVYDDNNYEIILDYNEWKNYTFENLYNFYDDGNFGFTPMIVTVGNNKLDLEFDESVDNETSFIGNYDYTDESGLVTKIYHYQYTLIWNETTYKFERINYGYYEENDPSDYVEDENYLGSLSIYSDDGYSQLKNAIEQDIIANQPYSFDDTNYQITISADYLNNFKFEYLFNYISENYSYFNTNLVGTSIVYNNVVYNHNVTTSQVMWYSKQAGSFIRLFNDYEWQYSDNNSSQDFSYPIVWQLNNTTYQMIKNAIIQDLEYGEYISIFGELTDSTTGFIGVLNSGIQEVVNVFYYDNALTTIGILSVLVIAISLGYFLFRLLVGLIRMKG